MAEKGPKPEKARRGRPATSPKEKEDEMISLAIKLAEEKLRDGTAPTNVIVHYLKLGSTRGMLENEMLATKTELVKAQKESIESSQRVEELYAQALEAMHVYQGNASDDQEVPQDIFR